jgi:hypothetical protein
MSRPREGRYETAKHLAEDLDRFLTQQPVLARRQTLAHRIAKQVKKRAALVAGLAAILLLAGAAAYFYARPGPGPRPDGADRLKEWSEFFPRLQRAISADTFDPSAATPLLARMEKEFPEQKAAVELLMNREHKEIARALERMPRSDWLDSAPRVRQYRDWLAFAKKPTEAADRILRYRGTFTLTVQVAPYAEIRGPLVETVPPEERVTPFTRKDLEIRDGALELVHPTLGTHAVALPNLRHGTTLTVEGSMKDFKSIKLSEGP